jgi:serine/threonine protein kinase
MTELLGKGGFGTVYKQKYGDEFIAVKTYNKEVDYLEIDVMASHDHKNLLGIKTIFEDGEKLTIGMPLGHSVQVNGVDKEKVMFDLCQGLEYLHRSGILHLDIKMGNTIMVGDTAKLIDFGLCVQGGVKALRNGVRCAKEKYTYLHRAPEVAVDELRDEVRTVSTKSDVFALGWALVNLFGTLYEIPKKTDHDDMFIRYCEITKQNPEFFSPAQKQKAMKEILADHTMTSYYYHFVRTRNEMWRETLLEKIVPKNLPNRAFVISTIFSMLSWNPDGRPEMSTIINEMRGLGLIKYERGINVTIFDNNPPNVPTLEQLHNLYTVVPDLDICYVMMILELNSRLRGSKDPFTYATAYVFDGLCPMVGDGEYYVEQDGRESTFLNNFARKMYLAQRDDSFWKSQTVKLEGCLASPNLIYMEAKNKLRLVYSITGLLGGKTVEEILQLNSTFDDEYDDKELPLSAIIFALENE